MPAPALRRFSTLVALSVVACGGGTKPAGSSADDKPSPALSTAPITDADAEKACVEIAKNDAACSTQTAAEDKARGMCTRGVACMRGFMRPEAIRPYLDCSRSSACDHDKCIDETAAKMPASPALSTFLAKCDKSCGGKLDCKKLGSPILMDETWAPVSKCFDENADCAAAGLCAGMQILGVAGKGMTCIEQAMKEPGASASASAAGEGAPLATEPMERAADIDKKRIPGVPMGAPGATYGFKTATKGTKRQPNKPIANLPTTQAIVYGFIDKKVAYVRADMSTGDCNAFASQLEKDLGAPRTRRLPGGKEDRGWFGNKTQIVLHLDGPSVGLCLVEIASPKQDW